MIPLLQVVPRTTYAGFGRNWNTSVALPDEDGTFCGVFIGIRFKFDRVMLSYEDMDLPRSPGEVQNGMFRPEQKIADVPIEIELDDSFELLGSDPQLIRSVWNCRLLAFLAEAHVLAFPKEAKRFNADMREAGAGHQRRLRWMQASKRVWLEAWGPVPDASWSVFA